MSRIPEKAGMPNDNICTENVPPFQLNSLGNNFISVDDGKILPVLFSSGRQRVQHYSLKVECQARQEIQERRAIGQTRSP